MPINTIGARWYRVPYVWLLIAIPLSAVVFGIYMLRMAIQSEDGLVVDDYYKRGKEINRVIHRDMAAANQGLRAALEFDFSGQKADLLLSAHAAPHTVPVEIKMRFLHPVRAGMDHVVNLHRASDSSYYALIPVLHDGHWYIQLETDDWRLSGSLVIPRDTRIVLTPSYAKEQ